MIGSSSNLELSVVALNYPAMFHHFAGRADKSDC